MINKVRRFLGPDGISLSRRHFLTTSAAVAGGLAITRIIGSGRAAPAALKEVRFSEAAHNLGYINLYVGLYTRIFQINCIDTKVTAPGAGTQTLATRIAR